jgi:hypothetical protein
MFICSRPFLMFDHFRVPYDVRPKEPADGTVTLVARSSTERSLHWPAFDEVVSPPACRFHLGPLILYGRLLPDDTLRARMTATGGRWRPDEPLTDGTRSLGSVWRNDLGDVFLPFDPDEVMCNFWRESYHDDGASGRASRIRSSAVSAYYLLRPLVPRRAQIAARRLYSRVQARTPFPRWPVEPSLHGICERVLDWAAEIAGAGVPHLAAWPDGRTWALVLTHDVETGDGLRRLPVLRDVEVAAGFRSSWNLVPGRYPVPDDVVAALKNDGFEVGLHGLYHDGRDLADGIFQQRLPQIRQWSRRWEVSGFRSPATHRAWDTMRLLPFEYDSSYPDTDPFEPQPGGCCSWLPFFNGELVELPITLPQDHTVFVILRHRDGQVWIEKCERIRAAGGMALLITHPDYVGQGPVVEAYRQLLARYAEDVSVWRALPVEVNRWWRRRAESRLEPAGDGWRVVGPASGEARVVVSPSPGHR